jgi:hypothetical protein
MTTDTSAASTLVMLTREGMGHGDEELQKKLLRTWLTLQLENGTAPGAICFYTEAVKLVVEGSEFLDLLKALEAKGTHLVVCTTCLKHYDLFDKVAAGTVGGMGDILAAQLSAKKVITL